MATAFEANKVSRGHRNIVYRLPLPHITFHRSTFKASLTMLVLYYADCSYQNIATLKHRVGQWLFHAPSVLNERNFTQDHGSKYTMLHGSLTMMRRKHRIEGVEQSKCAGLLQSSSSGSLIFHLHPITLTAQTSDLSNETLPVNHQPSTFLLHL